MKPCRNCGNDASDHIMVFSLRTNTIITVCIPGDSFVACGCTQYVPAEKYEQKAVQEAPEVRPVASA